MDEAPTHLIPDGAAGYRLNAARLDRPNRPRSPASIDLNEATACEFESFSSCPFAFSQVPASEHYNKSALALKIHANCSATVSLAYMRPPE